MNFQKEWIEKLAGFKTLSELHASDFFQRHWEEIVSFLQTPQIASRRFLRAVTVGADFVDSDDALLVESIEDKDLSLACDHLSSAPSRSNPLRHLVAVLLSLSYLTVGCIPELPGFARF